MSRIAIAQIKSSTEKKENLAIARALIDEANSKSAQLIAFPEFLMAFSPGEQSAADLAAPPQALNGVPVICEVVGAIRKR